MNRTTMRRTAIPRGLSLGMLLLTATSAAATAEREIHFRAPHSGERVAGYTVQLPVSRSEERSFSVPGQCPEALAALRDGADRWGGRVDKRLWWKVESDCRYHAFVAGSGAAGVGEDFVGGYDFANAAFADLPLEGTCDPEAGCRGGRQGLSEILPLVEQLPEPAAAGACRLHEGLFRGWVRRDGDGLICAQDPLAPGLRLVAVDYADVNGDGYRDAVLRLVPVGRRLSREALVLPLTRTGPEGRFTIPAEVAR